MYNLKEQFILDDDALQHSQYQTVYFKCGAIIYLQF